MFCEFQPQMFLGKPHISDFTHKLRNVNCRWGGGGGAAVTFLCDTWENSIFLLKNFGIFGNILEGDIN